MCAAKVQDKQAAIIEAAINVFAARGFWDTPTSLVSKTAKVADGTLFNYFETKDDLIQEVYLDIKREVAKELMTGFAEQPTPKDKFHHIWTHNIDWSVANPEKFKVLRQIGGSYKLSPKALAQANEPFIEVDRLTKESIANGLIRNYPSEYLAALVDGQAAVTIQFINQDPKHHARYKTIGFEILWNGMTR